MIRLESLEDEFKGVVTYRLNNGRYVQLNVRDVREYGAARMLRDRGYSDLLPTSTERVPVMWHGKKVGTVPACFDPLSIKSATFLYDPRPGDFRREGNAWLANRTLGHGDLEAVPGFVWDSAARQS